MGDVDLFALAKEGEALTVNAKWLQHLEERLLGEDGHPRKAREGEDPNRWVAVCAVFLNGSCAVLLCVCVCSACVPCRMCGNMACCWPN